MSMCVHIWAFFFFFSSPSPRPYWGLFHLLLRGLVSEWLKCVLFRSAPSIPPKPSFPVWWWGEGGEPEDWSQFILSSTAFTDFLLDRLLGFWAANASCLQSSLGWDFHTNHCHVDTNTGPMIALGNKWRASKPCCISSFHFDVLLPCCASWLLFLRQQNASWKDVFLSVGAPVSTL